MQALLDGFFAAHRVNLDAEPTPDALRAMQRLLDGVRARALARCRGGLVAQ